MNPGLGAGMGMSASPQLPSGNALQLLCGNTLQMHLTAILAGLTYVPVIAEGVGSPAGGHGPWPVGWHGHVSFPAASWGNALQLRGNTH